MGTASRQQRGPAIVLFVVAAIIASSCASRVSHEDLLAAAQASSPQATTSVGAGDKSALVDNGAGTDGAVTGDGTTASTVASTNGSTSEPISSTGGSASNGTKASTTGCTTPRETLNIGSVGEQSGLFGPLFTGTIKAVQAWLASVNARGGINCHQLRYIVKDDRGDPSTHQAQVRELVEQDHVVAFVMMDAPIPGGSSVQYLTEKGVPVIGTAGGEDWFYDSPVFRPQITTGTRALEGIIYMLAAFGLPKGQKRLGTITCVEVSLCSSLYKNAPALAAKVGLQVVYQSQTSILAPTDFRGPCQQAKDAGVQLLFPGMDTNTLLRLLAACDSVGFHPQYATGGILVTKDLLQDPRAVGMLVAPGTPLFTDMSVPAIADMTRTIKKYLPSFTPDAPAVVGWAAAMLFQKILERTAEPVTSDAILRAAGTIKDDNNLGLGPQLNFTYGQKAPPTTCYWAGEITTSKSFGVVPELGPGRRCV